MSFYESEKTEISDGKIFSIPDKLREKMVLYSICSQGGLDGKLTVNDLNDYLKSREMADVLGLKDNQKIEDFGNLLINRYLFKLEREKEVEMKKEIIGEREVNVYYPVDVDGEKTQRLGSAIRKMWKEEEKKSLEMMNSPIAL